MDVLLREDDADLGQAVANHLVAAGHRVCWRRSIAQAEVAAAPVLALLDLRLPDGDGLTLLRRWRAAGQAWPVIVLTAHDQISDRIRGLQACADDYLVKPLHLDELLARVDAVARRALAPLLATTADGGLQLDLTQMEGAVLARLAPHRGRIYSRGEIEGWLAGLGLADAQSNSLEVIVGRLRRKLGAGAISTHRGQGYRLEH